MNYTYTGWRDNTGYGYPDTAWPRNVKSPTLEGWPSTGQRRAHPAVDILSNALGWWDVSDYREGDRFLRNLGIGGQQLNMRLGSSELFANSNDPTLVTPVGDGHWFKASGVNTSFLGCTPSLASSTNVPSGDIEILVDVQLDSYQGTPGPIFYNTNSATNLVSYGLRTIGVSGTIEFLFTIAGDASNRVITSTVNLTNGVRYQIKLTRNSSTGEIKIFLSTDDYQTFNEVFSTTSVTGALSRNASSSGQVLTMFQAGSGRYFRALVLDGIGGTPMFDFDLRTQLNPRSQSNTTTNESYVGAQLSNYTSLQPVIVTQNTSDKNCGYVASVSAGMRPYFSLGGDDYLRVPTRRLDLYGGDHGGYSIVFIMRAIAVRGDRSPFFTASGYNGGVVPTAAPGWNLYSYLGSGVRWSQRSRFEPNNDIWLEASSAQGYTHQPYRCYVGVSSAKSSRLILYDPFYEPSDANAFRSSGEIREVNMQRERVGGLWAINDDLAFLTVGLMNIAGMFPYGCFDFFAAAFIRREITRSEALSIAQYYGVVGR